jgi:hypothetical protein
MSQHAGRMMRVNIEGGPARIDTTRPHPARRYDYWLGGKDNFQADREAGDAIAAVFPSIRTAARENRAFMQRAVRFLAGEAGVRQFLDIGTGLPTADNVHDVAQGIAPESRIVYVDNDPLVLTHARALLTSSDEGATAYIDADVRDPKKILAAAHDTLDFDQPVALLLVALLHFIEDAEDPWGIVHRLTTALPAGSYLVLSHATFDPLDAETIAAMNAVNASIKPTFTPRSLDAVTRFFAGDDLELLEPGIVSVSDWRPESDDRPTPAQATGYGAVAIKA